MDVSIAEDLGMAEVAPFQCKHALLPHSNHCCGYCMLGRIEEKFSDALWLLSLSHK